MRRKIMNWEIFGLVAGIITVSGFVPQIIKGYKTKHMKDLSYMMNAMLLLGMTMWFIYGINKRSVAIVATNLIGMAFNIAMMAMKYHFSRTASAGADA
jgi:MtN3 and saliva related transmembrane protein